MLRGLLEKLTSILKKIRLRVMKEIPLNERIIFALDVPSMKESIEWIDRLGSHIRFYKVGLQLFLAGGWPVIEGIIARGHKVMLDLKFFDIPETVQKAVSQLKNRGVTFATIHGNRPIIEAAVSEKNGLKILAVTVLTSFDESDMKAMGLKGAIKDLVLLRAEKAIDLGCDGIVASPLEAPALRNKMGNNFLIITPGIRPGINRDMERDDQKRVASALEAIRNGADYVVIGRPISSSPDPIKTIEDIQEEILKGLEGG